jgi:hypothetical protein
VTHRHVEDGMAKCGQMLRLVYYITMIPVVRTKVCDADNEVGDDNNDRYDKIDDAKAQWRATGYNAWHNIAKRKQMNTSLTAYNKCIGHTLRRHRPKDQDNDHENDSSKKSKSTTTPPPPPAPAVAPLHNNNNSDNSNNTNNSRPPDPTRPVINDPIIATSSTATTAAVVALSLNETKTLPCAKYADELNAIPIKTLLPTYASGLTSLTDLRKYHAHRWPNDQRVCLLTFSVFPSLPFLH